MIFAGIGHIIIWFVFYGYIILSKVIWRYDLLIKSKKKLPYISTAKAGSFTAIFGKSSFKPTILNDVET